MWLPSEMRQARPRDPQISSQWTVLSEAKAQSVGVDTEEPSIKRSAVRSAQDKPIPRIV